MVDKLISSLLPNAAATTSNAPVSGKTPIRLLYFTREGFPIQRADVDVLFGREMLKRGHEIDLVIQSGTPAVAGGRHSWYSRSAYVGRTVDGGALSAFMRHWLAFWHDVRALGLARRDRYDAIQFRDKFLIAALGLLISRSRGLKFFYWLSFPYPESDLTRARTGDTRFPAFAYVRGIVSGLILYRWIIPRADHTFVQSEQMKAEFVARGMNAAQMSAVPMGIDLEDISAANRLPHERIVGRDTIVLGYLGALDKDRHLSVLVEMLALLKSEGFKMQLHLIGDAQVAEDRLALQRLATELDVADMVQITGFLPRVTALQRMKATDIALSPIYPTPMFRVASPTKLIEYLALGIPVVANVHPEQRRILRASRAGLCTPWSARQFARGVRWLARLTPEQRAEMGRRGQEWAIQNRCYKSIADNLENSYFKYLGNARQPS